MSMCTLPLCASNSALALTCAAASMHASLQSRPPAAEHPGGGVTIEPKESGSSVNGQRDGAALEAAPNAGQGLVARPMVGEVERVVRARGSLFLVTTRQGDVDPPGARELGLFHSDTRFLSHYKLDIGGNRPVGLSAEPAHGGYKQPARMVSGSEHEELLDDPKNFLHIRRRQLLDGGLIEEMVFTNFLMRACELEVLVRFGVDFADVFEVRGAQRPRRGTVHPSRIEGSSVIFAYTGLCETRYETIVSVGTCPTYMTEDHALLWLRRSPGRSLGM